MRKLIVVCLWCCLCPVVTQATTTHEQRVEDAWRRVYAVESSCGRDPDAYRENHVRALGPAQVTPIMLADVNRILGCYVFGLSDRLSLEASKEMFRVAQRHYNKNATVETMCRFWLRGPSRSRQQDKYGDEYWQQCQRKAGMR